MKKNSYQNIIGKFLQPEILFVTLSIVAGILISLLLPPFRGPDEASHIFRSYELSKGDIFLNSENGSNGFRIPDALQRVNIASFQVKGTVWNQRTQKYYDAGVRKNTDGNQFQSFEGAGVYPPFAYINYLPFSSLGRLLHINEYYYTLLLRIGGLLVSIFIIYLAIRVTPVGKWLIVAIGLLPMSIHQMSVVSTDGLVISSSLLFIACVLAIYFQTKKKPRSNDDMLSWRTVAMLVISGTLVASKPGYWPLLLLIFITLPNLRSMVAVKNYRHLLIVIIPVMTFVLWYGLLIWQHQNTLQNYFETANPGSTLVSPKQIIKETINPIKLADRFTETYLVQPYFPRLNFDFAANYQPTFVFNTFIGSFGSLAAYPPSWLSITVLLSLVLGLFITPTIIHFKKRDRVISAILISLGFILITYIFWLSWTAEDMPFVFGVQGRYFIPLLALLLVFIPAKKMLNISHSTHLRLLVSCIIINIVVTILTIKNYFYAV